MLIFLATLLATLSSILRSRAALELENLALRHQIGVLQQVPPASPQVDSTGPCVVGLAVRHLERLALGLGYRQTGNVGTVKKSMEPNCCNLLGEKLINFADAAERYPEFAAELPRFQAAVWNLFNPYELAGYLSSLKPARRKKLQELLYVDSLSKSRRPS